MWEWEQSHSYIFMIKQIIASTLLATSIGIQNTTITQTTNRIVYMDKQSYWTINNILNQGGIQTGIEAYRDIQTKNEINTEAFTIKQRIVEAYTARTDLDFYVSNWYFVMSIEAKTNIDLKAIDTIINGSIQNIYNINLININYLEEENTVIADSAIENFLNGTIYTTKNEYTTVISHINTKCLSGVNVSLDSQNYADIINNKKFPYTMGTEGTPINLFYNITITWDDANIPITNPYTPFGNYGNQITYNNIQYLVDVNTGGTGEIVDIPGIMFAMLGMPFTFVAQAFNLTIFPGTAYAINLSQIFLAIVGAGILLFIIKKIIK